MVTESKTQRDRVLIWVSSNCCCVVDVFVAIVIVGVAVVVVLEIYGDARYPFVHEYIGVVRQSDAHDFITRFKVGTRIV